MTITYEELENNIDRYLEIVSNEDIYITKNDEIIAKLSKPQIDKIAIINSLIGVAASEEEIDVTSIREERLSKL